MEIVLHNISVKDLFNGFKDNKESGVVGYGGKLNIRPPYQREFIYNKKQQIEVINSILKGYPLNVMYWIKTNDDNFELLDGQQRTLSICSYMSNDFSINDRYYHSLTETETKQLEEYKLFIYICEGNDKEQLEWFKTINLAGEKLTDQEIRNALYTGQWLTDAKKYFSKTGCPAYSSGGDYIKGVPIRQDYLERTLKWMAHSKNTTIENYMSLMQHNPNANELWLYFQNVITWVKTVFRVYRPEMKGIDWGILYNKYKDCVYDSNNLELNIQSMMLDEEIQKKTGIYEYLLSKDKKHLNIRTFTPSMKRIAYQKQGGKCASASCPSKDKVFEINEMEGDHIIPWCSGGKTTQQNCQMLCRACNRAKSCK